MMLVFWRKKSQVLLKTPFLSFFQENSDQKLTFFCACSTLQLSALSPKTYSAKFKTARPKGNLNDPLVGWLDVESHWERYSL